jgi:hypothetical protein
MCSVFPIPLIGVLPHSELSNSSEKFIHNLANRSSINSIPKKISNLGFRLLHKTEKPNRMVVIELIWVYSYVGEALSYMLILPNPISPGDFDSKLGAF